MFSSFRRTSPAFGRKLRVGCPAPAGGAGQSYLFLFTSPTTSRSSTPCRCFLLARGTRRDRRARVRGGRGRADRANIEFNRQFRSAATIYGDNASGIDAARIDHIVLGSVGPGLSLSLASAIGED